MEERNVLKTNEVSIVGTLVDVEGTPRVSREGEDFISLKLTVKSLIQDEENTDLPAREQVTEISLYSKKLKKGTQELNKLYAKYINVPNLLGKRVSISGEIKEDKFFSERNGDMVSFNGVRGRFVQEAKPSEIDKADFSFAGYVRKPLAAKTNRDGEVIHYELQMAQANYNDKMPINVTLSIDKDNEGIISILQEIYLAGVTGLLSGEFLTTTSIVEKTVQTDTASFGTPKTQVFTNVYKTLRVSGGNEPIPQEDSGAYKPDFMMELKTAYDKDSVKREEDAKNREEAGQSVIGNKTATKTDSLADYI